MGWSRLWDSVMELGLKHVPGLQNWCRIYWVLMVGGALQAIPGCVMKNWRAHWLWSMMHLNPQEAQSLNTSLQQQLNSY